VEEFYQTDHRRLESVIEAGKRLKHYRGECAVCGSTPAPNQKTTLQEFTAAADMSGEVAGLGDRPQSASRTSLMSRPKLPLKSPVSNKSLPSRQADH